MNPRTLHPTVSNDSDRPATAAPEADFLDRAKRFLESCARDHRTTAIAPRSELDIILCALLGPARLQRRREGPKAAIRAILIEKS